MDDARMNNRGFAFVFEGTVAAKRKLQQSLCVWQVVSKTIEGGGLGFLRERRISSVARCLGLRRFRFAKQLRLITQIAPVQQSRRPIDWQAACL